MIRTGHQPAESTGHRLGRYVDIAADCALTFMLAVALVAAVAGR